MLTSLKNPWVKTLRKLDQAKYRRSHRQFLVEGTHLVQEAVATEYPLEGVCATVTWQTRYPDLWQQLRERTQRQETVNDEVLRAIATTETPDGVVAIAPIQPESPALMTPPHLGIFLEAIQDPGNLGTLIRTAAAVGCDGIWLTQDCVDLTHPKVLRASAGQWFRIKHWVATDPVAQLAHWQQQGCAVVATASKGAVPYWRLDLQQPTVLLLGNEGAGLSAPLEAIAQQTVAIPMINEVESLNVGIAAAVILFEAVRQRQLLK